MTFSNGIGKWLRPHWTEQVEKLAILYPLNTRQLMLACKPIPKCYNPPGERRVRWLARDAPSSQSGPEFQGLPAFFRNKRYNTMRYSLSDQSLHPTEQTSVCALDQVSPSPKKPKRPDPTNNSFKQWRPSVLQSGSRWGNGDPSAQSPQYQEMSSDPTSRKSIALAGMRPLLGEGGQVPVGSLCTCASDITEQLSKETGGHARNNRWSWRQGMWAFHFQVKVLQFTESTYNSREN